MPRPIVASVSPAALRHNLEVVRRHVPGAKVWAVVKANAYGHGLAHALEGFAAADGLALLEWDAAQRLRELGWQRPILMLEGAFEPADLAVAASFDLAVVVHDVRQVDWLAEHAGAPIAVHLKVNTGMNRLGIPPADVPTVHRRLARLAQVRSVTLMTHFANADVAGGAEVATHAFERCTVGLDGERSLANSAAVLACPDTHRDWVRPGIMLYGASPFADRSAASLGLAPAMSLRSQLIGVQSLAAGDTVGYGATFTAERAMRIGIVACGYADGYPRHAPTGTPVAVDGVRTRSIGRVSMDMMAVDLQPVPRADVGTPVELWGDAVPVDEVAASAGTIGYELLCALAPRVPVVTDRDTPITPITPITSVAPLA
jgi:alanine racemase